MSLSNEERVAIVAYRIEKAEATFVEAERVAELGMYNLAANRMYYALYYAASALLIHSGYMAHTHSGVISQIHLHFVKENILSREEGALISRMFSLRQESDYEDFIELTEQEISSYKPLVGALLLKLKSLALE